MLKQIKEKSSALSGIFLLLFCMWVVTNAAMFWFVEASLNVMV